MTSRVVLVGANPIVRLFDGDRVTAFASVWIVEWSIMGSGSVLVLWHDERVRVVGENPRLAAWLADDFTRHFPEAEGLTWQRGDVEEWPVTARVDLATGMTVSTGYTEINASTILDRRGFATDAFDLGGQPHGLSLVLAPVAEAAIRVDGELLPGAVRRDRSAERPGSSAFLTAAEVWTRPVA